ncbi:NUDIX domain-containing protein [Streptomyces sp. NPDC056004]|uniref:NUDIX domain-containing protein n=1 Tax=Streptomyces sp. NPDC056004 TaxID=3345677 RepID=UPI0035E24836
MTPTTRPGEQPRKPMSDEEYAALRARAALWAGASALITNRLGKVLIQHVDYRDTCLLPGGGVDEGESPARAAAREVMEELGIDTVADRALAVDWVSAEGFGARPSVRFPGEIVHVFDGGTWDEIRIAKIRLPDHEITGIEFVEPSQLPDKLSPSDARRALSALRARINAAGTVLLENGLPINPTVLDRLAVLHTARAELHYPWHEGPSPHERTVTKVQGWLFAPDGRILVLLEPETGTAHLPGGVPEPQDQGDPASTLCRETAKLAAALLRTPLLLGHLTDPRTRHTHLRYAARFTDTGAPPAGPETGRSHTRILATPEQAIQLFDWGEQTTTQLAAVHQARRRLGLPRAAPQPVTELPGPTS